MSKTVQIKVTVSHTGAEYASNPVNDASEKAIEDVRELCEQAAGGELRYLRINVGETSHYFPAELLSMCIVSVAVAVFGEENEDA